MDLSKNAFVAIGDNDKRENFENITLGECDETITFENVTISSSFFFLNDFQPLFFPLKMFVVYPMFNSTRMF